MSEQERQQRFMELMRQAEQECGYTLTMTTLTEKLGEAVLIKPVLAISPVVGWIPPTSESAKTQV